MDEKTAQLTGKHMEVPDRLEYEAWRSQFSSWSGMDERIIPMVAAFNARGLATWGSCEGHPDEFPQGTWYPWIHFGTKEGDLAASFRD